MDSAAQIILHDDWRGTELFALVQLRGDGGRIMPGSLVTKEEDD